MAYLAAATVLVGLLAAVNLLFTVGVIRRLREHTAELAARRNQGTPGTGVAHPAGARIGDFTATTVAGDRVDAGTPGDRLLAGFFSPNCGPCKDRLPGFLAYAAARSGGPERILAVVAGTTEESAALVDQLRPVATVVVEPDQGPVQQAFGIAGFPAFVLVDDGWVAASDFDLAPVAERDGAALAPA
jgi:thiol-disulfide isomerase/thioredoxin